MRLGSLLAGALLLLQAQLAGAAAPSDRWFEDVKKNATPEQLYTFLYALPKGGDLHNHLTGAAFPEWMWDAAIATEKQGYIYYTKVAIHNCVPYGTDQFGPAPYLLLFRNITAATWAQLDDCQKSGFKRPHELSHAAERVWVD